MNLNYYDLNEKGFNIICSVLDKYCVHYKSKTNTKEIIFGHNSSYEIHTQELKPEAYIFIKDKIEEKLLFIADLDSQHNLPAVEPEWELDKDNKNQLTLADLIERKLQGKEDTSLASFSFDPYEYDEEAEWNIVEDIKNCIIKGWNNIIKFLFSRKSTNESINLHKNNKIKDMLDEVFTEKTYLTFDKLPRDVKEILLSQLPLHLLKDSKFQLIRREDGFAIHIDREGL